MSRKIWIIDSVKINPQTDRFKNYYFKIFVDRKFLKDPFCFIFFGRIVLN